MIHLASTMMQGKIFDYENSFITSAYNSNFVSINNSR